MDKVFLGGTCAETTWREYLISVLQVPYFNPVVEDWTEDCQAQERYEKEDKCNIHLYVITKEMQGVFSIAEVIDSAYNLRKLTILHIIPSGFSVGQLKSLKATVELVKSIGGIAYIDHDLFRAARIINNSFK